MDNLIRLMLTTSKMVFKRDNIRVIFEGVLVLAISGMCVYMHTYDNLRPKDSLIEKHDNLNIRLMDMVNTRNAMSRQLNDAMKKMGELECKMINFPGHKHVRENGTTGRGGYCYRTTHYTFDGMVRQLADLFEGKTVGSFGDGLGEYKTRIMRTGKPKSYDAFDGAPLCEDQSKGIVKFLDLAVQQFGLPLYDWVVSIEVAEHIPKAYEHIYMENLVRHASEGIVNSWATPGQTGFYHVNGRDLEYVIKLFRSYGFEHDMETSKRIQNGTDGPNLKRNTNVYRRIDLETIDNLTYYS